MFLFSSQQTDVCVTRWALKIIFVFNALTQLHHVAGIELHASKACRMSIDIRPLRAQISTQNVDPPHSQLISKMHLISVSKNNFSL